MRQHRTAKPTKPTKQKPREWHIWNDAMLSDKKPNWKAHRWHGKDMGCYGCIRVREVRRPR